MSRLSVIRMSKTIDTLLYDCSITLLHRVASKTQQQYHILVYIFVTFVYVGVALKSHSKLVEVSSEKGPWPDIGAVVSR